MAVTAQRCDPAMAAAMNGIFSPRPCQTAIRLMIGAHLLLIIEAALLAWSVVAALVRMVGARRGGGRFFHC